MAVQTQLLGDLEAHEEYWQEIKPKVDMFAVAVKEMSKDKSGTNNVADGNKDETEDKNGKSRSYGKRCTY